SHRSAVDGFRGVRKLIGESPKPGEGCVVQANERGAGLAVERDTPERMNHFRESLLGLGVKFEVVPPWAALGRPDQNEACSQAAGDVIGVREHPGKNLRLYTTADCGECSFNLHISRVTCLSVATGCPAVEHGEPGRNIAPGVLTLVSRE